MSTRADITFEDDWFLGEDYAIIFTITEDESSDVILDVTGYTTQFKLTGTKFGAALFTRSGTVTNGPLGEITVTIPSVQTINLPPSSEDLTYYYNLRKIDAGSRAELSYGEVVLLDPWVE